MTQKQTPGPWKVEEIWNITTGEVKYYVKDHDEQTICDLYFTKRADGEAAQFFKHPNDKANAALIAAAPDLLNELEQSTAEMDLMLRNEALEINAEIREMLQGQIAANRAAIARATVQS